MAINPTCEVTSKKPGGVHNQAMEVSGVAVKQKFVCTPEFTNMTIAGQSTMNEDVFPIENNENPMSY